MKTKMLSVLATMIVVFGLITSTRANSRSNAAATILSDISNIHQIEVRGNVELYISDATTDQVKVYNKYYAESALVQNRNGVLRISSYTGEKLIVWVSAKDLRSVSMFDNSEVKSFGKLSEIEFNVDLHDQAIADLDLNAFNTTLIVKDHAKANLKGAVQEFSLNKEIGTNVERDHLTTKHLYERQPAFTSAPAKRTLSI